MRRGAAHHRDDERRAGEAIALERELIGGGLRIVGREGLRDDRAARSRASPSNTMNRHGASLP